MKISQILFFIFLALRLSGQTIGSFTSVQPAAPNEVFQFPSSHAVQKLIQVGDPAGNIGSLPPLPDFTGYVPTDGSSTLGQLSLNHEIDDGDGKVSMFDLIFDSGIQIWELSNSSDIDFTGVGGTSRDCAGNLTPWGTVIIGEEEITGLDNNDDGYRDWGWLVEIDPVSRTVVDKVWAAGNCLHENAAFLNDQTTFYAGSDDANTGFFYKFIADNPADLSSGSLFVLQRDGPNSTTGEWLLLPNETQEERNNTTEAANNLDATNFNGVEGVKIGPDGKVYFAAQGTGSIYRFTDDGTTVSNFERWVGPSTTNYVIHYGNNSQAIPWGLGNDNIAFDGEGNLWVLQDGGNNHIWMVKANHTPANPHVELFGISPIGAEPTGICFTPDFNYLFMSFQSASGSNSVTVTDAAGNEFEYDRGTVMVLARSENLGLPLPLELTWFDAEVIGTEVRLNWRAANAVGFDNFGIERSIDGTSFHTIGQIRSPAVSFIAQQFSFSDKNATAGCYYYRLKMNDINGEFTYSPIRAACLQESVPEMEILGNPLDAGKSASLRLNRWPANQLLEISVANVDGSVLYSQMHEPCETHCILELPFEFQQAGFYSVRCASGYSTNIKKVLVR